MVLLAGIGLDMTYWPGGLLEGLQKAGFQLILLDNRDAGRSMLGTKDQPSLWRLAMNQLRSDDYALSDMADDTIAVMDHLGHAQFHVLGFSMGGMIAQEIGIRFPERVLGLTCLSTTTGAPLVGHPSIAAVIALLRRPPDSCESYVAFYLRVMRLIAGRDYPLNEAQAEAYARRAWARGIGPTAQTPLGSASARLRRQLGAIKKSGNRTQRLRSVLAPTLVVHADRDKLVAPSGGQDLVRVIPNAELVILKGAGHDLADGLVSTLVEAIARKHQHAPRRQRA